MTPEQKVTYTVPEAARLLGISRNSLYDAASRGEIPTLKLGRRLLVPAAALARMLGDDLHVASKEPQASQDEPTEWTYLVTVRRLRENERVRIVSD